MTTKNQILAFIDAAFAGNRERMNTIAFQIAAAQKDGRTRDEIRRLANSQPRQLLPLSHACQQVVLELPTRLLADMHLSEGNLACVRRVVDEQRARVPLINAGLQPASKVLLYGPPGNGKTALAGAIANVLGWPGYLLCLSSVMSAYLGTTGGNLEKAWEVTRHRGVLMLDELDAVGSSRGGTESGASKEYNAIVSTLLKLLDAPQEGLILAATNRPDLLDPAVRRRFDVEVELPAPTDWTALDFLQRLNAKWGTSTSVPVPLRSFDQLEKRVLADAKSAVLGQVALTSLRRHNK